MSVGPHSITADYTSNAAAFADSSATPFAQVVDTNTAVALSCAPNPSLLGQIVVCTATVTSAGGATPVGTITFEIDGAGAVVVPLDAAGQASFSTSTLTLGAHTIDAAYTPGSQAFASSAAPAFGQQVGTILEVPTLGEWALAALALLLAISALWKLGSGSRGGRAPA
jgi:hypothetical protein